MLPLFHVGGLSIALRAVIYGIPMLLHASFDAARVHAAIDADGATIVSVVSTMVQRMLDARGAAPYPPTLRCLLLGGGPAPQPLLEACAARAVGENLALGYPTPLAVVAGWMGSDGHRANILNPTYTQIGVACTASPKGQLCAQVFLG